MIGIHENGELKPLATGYTLGTGGGQVPQGAYYDLVWQNPNGIGSMTALMGGETALTLTKSTNSFDGFLCEFRCYYNTGQKTYGYYFTGASGMYAQTTVIREVGNPMMEFSRAWWASGDTTITVSDCTRIVSNGSNVVGQDTGCLVPLRIWGIKLVSPFQTDCIVEQGTSGIWTYRKWNSGVAECWGEYETTITHYASAFGGYAYNTSVDYPTGLFISAPQYTYSAKVGSGFALTGTRTGVSKDYANLYAVCTDSGSKATSWDISVKGKWK